MFRLRRARKKVRSALQNIDLQQALERASTHHLRQFKANEPRIKWSELKLKAQEIRQKNLEQLPQLIEQFCSEARRSGAQIYWAETASDARNIIEKIIRQKKAKLVVKAKSMVSEEIELNSYLQQKGIKIIETDLGEWIVQLAGDRPSHITAPALHLTKEKMAELLKNKFHQDIPSQPEAIVEFARQNIRQAFSQAEIGLSGANFAVAETGSLLIISNEGNARLATSLPPVHIALLTLEKFVQTLEEAMTLTKALIFASSGNRMTAYVSLITGPSRTTDIEKQTIIGAHGPREVHIIILDNGRSSALQDKTLKQALTCFKCGGCLLVCPVFQAVGGHIYGGPIYPGGIGAVLTSITRSPQEALLAADLCADCKKCEDFCPMGVPTGEILLELKNRLPTTHEEKILSKFFRYSSLPKIAVKLGFQAQRLLKKDIQSWLPPLVWLAEKKLPPLPPHSYFPPLPEEKKEDKTKKKVFLFQGCLIRFLFPSIARAATQVLRFFHLEVISPPQQVCCGAPNLHLGQKKDFITLAQKNIQLICEANPDFILTLCPTGNAILRKKYPQEFPEFRPWSSRIFDLTNFLAIKEFFPPQLHQSKEKIFYHYSCHYLYELGLEKPPLEVLSNWGYQPIVEDEPRRCCGFAGAFSFKNPELAHHLWVKKKEKIEQSQLEIIATDCPGCIFQLKSYLQKDENRYAVYHTVELLAQRLSEKLRENSQ